MREELLMERLKLLVRQAARALEEGDTAGFSELMREITEVLKELGVAGGGCSTTHD
jgi:mevalonate kinase